jgi:hypothetical protein
VDCNFPSPNISPLLVYFSRRCLRLDRLHGKSCGHQDSKEGWSFADRETGGCVIDIEALTISLIGFLIWRIFFPLHSWQFHVSVDLPSKSLFRPVAS